MNVDDWTWEFKKPEWVDQARITYRQMVVATLWVPLAELVGEEEDE